MTIKASEATPYKKGGKAAIKAGKAAIKAKPVATIARSNPGREPGGEPAAGKRSDAVPEWRPKAAVTVALTTEPGSVNIPSVAGDRPVAYDKDEVVICDQNAATIAGPLSREHAIALATAVLEGQRRAVTHPQLHLLLAGAVLAFVAASPEPPRQHEEGSDGD